jgi:hypothetical protein
MACGGVYFWSPAYIILLNHLIDLVIDRRITLEWMLKNQVGRL